MTSERKIVALMPLKAHSERVPGKNFKPLDGRPLFQWVLDTLLSLDEVSEVVINTDARQLLIDNGLVESPRVRIRDRRPEICGDSVSMNAILADDLQAVDADLYLMTHTTNPFLGARTIRGAVGRYDEAIGSGHDSVFTVNKMQTRFYRKDGSPVNHDPNNLVRTQDLEPWFEENSCLYVFSKASFGQTNARIGARPIMFETPALESIDIDTPEDWQHAEYLAKGGFRPQ